MVETRAQRARRLEQERRMDEIWEQMANRPLPQYDEPATRRMQRARRWIKQYRPNDHAKRHRLNDDQPKTQHVISYTRRL